MRRHSDSSSVSRRGFLGGAIATGAALAVPQAAAAKDADVSSGILVAEVAADPSGTSADVTAVATSAQVQVDLLPNATVVLDASGEEGKLSDLAVGDTVAVQATPARVAASGDTGTLVASRVIPCVIGVESDRR